MANWLNALVGGLAGAGKAGADYYGRKRELAQEQAEKEAAIAREQTRWQQQFGLQQRQFGLNAGETARRAAAETVEAKRRALEQGRGDTTAQMQQYQLTEDLPADLAAKAREFGLRTSTVSTPGTTLGPASFSAPVPAFAFGSDAAGTPNLREVDAAPVVGGTAYGMGSVADRRGFKTPDEVAATELELAAAAEEAAGRPEMAAVLRLTAKTGGKLGGISPELLKTTAQRQQETKEEREFRLKEIAAMNAYRDQGGAAGGAAPPAQTDQAKAVDVLDRALAALEDIKPGAPGYGAAVGAGWNTVPFIAPPSGTDAGDFVTRFNNFEALQVLPNLTFMKGLGQMSNMEFENIKNASSSLKRQLSEPEYAKQHAIISENLRRARNRAMAGTNVVNDPDGDGQVGQAQSGRASGAGPAGQGTTRGPAIGETRVVNGVTYTWDGKGWVEG